MLHPINTAPSPIPSPVVPGRSVWHLIERQLRRRPDGTAVVSDTVQWSYADLGRAAAGVSAELCRQGVGPGEVVAVLCERSAELVASLLGIVRTGAVFLPLDPQYPASRLDSMLEEAAPKLVLHQQSFGGMGLKARPGPFVPVSPGRLLRSGVRTGAIRPLGPRQAAYAIFTSGSTGQPKAALLTHGGLLNLARVQRRAFGVEPGSRVLQFASPAFDASISEIFVTLTAGATLVIPGSRQAVPGETLVRTLRQQRISHLTIPPTLLAEMPQADIPELQTLVVAGEACTAEVASRWSRGRRLINAYGPTETAVCATLYSCPQGEQPRPPIGTAIPNCWTYVVNERGELCGEGEPGELYIGGVGVGLGYLNQPELTAERFVRDPFRSVAGQTVYRSGDLVQRRNDGNLEFQGRLDQQLKIRGIRIEPAEIVQALEGLPGVRQAVVAVQPGQSSPRLVAFAQPADGTPPPAAAIIRELRRRLPAHLVPTRLEWVSGFPRHPNGKVDLGSLERFPAPRRIPPGDAAGTGSPLERDVLRMFEQVLRKRGLRADDDFFLCGGDSLRALELLARIEEHSGKRLEPRRLLSSPTPAALARALGAAEPERRHPLIVPLAGAGDGRPLFCIHPGGGNVYCFLELARLLGPEMPVYGIQAHGIDDPIQPGRTIESLAEEYLEATATVPANHPGTLCGWSFGGLIAFEMARLLAERGQPPRVVLIDSGRLLAAAVVRAIFPDANVPLFQVPWLAEETLLETFCGPDRQSPLIPAGADHRLVRRIFRIFMENVEAAFRYRPGTLDADVVFIEAEDKLPGMRRAPSEEWRDHCRSLQVIQTPGSHLQLFRPPYVEALAETLKYVCQDGKRS